MEPLSITTGCLSLVGTITKVSITISTFVRTARDARSDLDSISRELLSLKTVLELLADDTQETPKSIPPTLEKQVSSIISNCDDVLQDIEKSLQKYEKVKRASAKWAWEGRDEIGRLRTTLEAHKSALELALDMVALSVIRDVKTDATDIKADTNAIKQDTTQILAEIARLQAQLPQGALQAGSSGFMLQRYLDEMTSYAETVVGGTIDSNEAIPDEERCLDFESRPQIGKHLKIEDPSESEDEIIEPPDEQFWLGWFGPLAVPPNEYSSDEIQLQGTSTSVACQPSVKTRDQRGEHMALIDENEPVEFDGLRRTILAPTAISEEDRLGLVKGDSQVQQPGDAEAQPPTRHVIFELSTLPPAMHYETENASFEWDAIQDADAEAEALQRGSREEEMNKPVETSAPSSSAQPISNRRRRRLERIAREQEAQRREESTQGTSISADRSPEVTIPSPREAAIPRESFPIHRRRETSSTESLGGQEVEPEISMPPSAGMENFPRRFVSFGRSTSELDASEEESAPLQEAEITTIVRPELQPIFMKGIFSVSTTSSKPLSFIREDIIRVLTKLEVDYGEIRGGFHCRTTKSVKSPSYFKSKGMVKSIMQFKIIVVKVPLVRLHGIQFKRVAGNTWKYKELAQAVLDNLRL